MPSDVELADALLAGLARYEQEQRLAAEHRARLLASASVATGLPADEIRGMVRDVDDDAGSTFPPTNRRIVATFRGDRLVSYRVERERGDHGRAHRVPRPRPRARAARRASGARRAAARAPAGSDSPPPSPPADRVAVLRAAFDVLTLLEQEPA